MDRLPWSRWHWMVVIGLGTVWILDGLAVTIVVAIGGRRREAGSGLELSGARSGSTGSACAPAAWVTAQASGRPTDKLCRALLFMLALVIIVCGRVVTALRMNWWSLLACSGTYGAG